MWQNIIVILIVALAAGYAGRKIWRSFAKPEQASCGCGCVGEPASGCPSAGGGQPMPEALPQACRGCAGAKAGKDAH